MKTKKAATVSTSRMAIWPSTSVLPELVAELAGAPQRGLERARQALGELLGFEGFERRFGRAALGGDVAPQRRGRLDAAGGELRRPEYGVQREPARVLGGDAASLGEGS